MSIYRRGFDKTKCTYFLKKDEIFFDKYNEIWKKISNIIKREVNSKLAYIKKYLKAEKNQHK